MVKTTIRLLDLSLDKASGRAAQQGAVADAAARPEIRAILRRDFVPSAISIYACGAAKRQGVRRHNGEQCGRILVFLRTFVTDAATQPRLDNIPSCIWLCGME